MIYVYIFFSTHHYCIFYSWAFPFFFLADESTDEEVSRPQTKEEEDIDILCSWVQVRGFPAHPEEAWGLLLEVSLLSSVSFCFHVAFYFSLHSYLCIFFHLSGAGSTEKGWFPEFHGLEMEAQHLETEGLGKMEVAVAGSEAEGFYGLLRGAMLHSSISPAPPLTRKSTTLHLPPSPIHP